MRYITPDDIIDTYQKIAQRGLGFIMSKLTHDQLSRTKSAFDNTAVQSANWWIVPEVKRRWNRLITGRPDQGYEDYVVANYLEGMSGIRMLSIGSGMCSHEIAFAQYPVFDRITCVDIADNLLEQAAAKAEQLGLSNMEFTAQDVYTASFSPGGYDVVLFHSSLHHFEGIEHLLLDRVSKWLRPGGLIIINEYVGVDRLQFSEVQLEWINKGLRSLPTRLKRRYKSRLVKHRYYGSGYWRMILADPSECVESSQILPVLRAHFEVVVERPMGGNLLMNILKDIAHNFTDPTDAEAQQALQALMALEDEYLASYDSDFMFGIYKSRR